ncbi:MAG: 2,3,4,5-tetrahydropyridine-2,6-dicarboxylate N-succinyltransferase [Holosporales bacterium]|jgi:2,3,4,5-tetrahydropyridine-2-carboxylate N-succinyltransferase|nr:2,3,4,5-tetrahydropyridine-2,6-dicarboxylate N-succinyltransferase [Holosporales bacterium]
MTDITDLKNKIDAFTKSDADSLNPDEVLDAVAMVIDLLNRGHIRVAEEKDGTWVVNTWIKQAILFGFKFRKAKRQSPDGFDKFAIRILSKPPESELLEGDTEHRTAAYLSVREDSSTESTHQEADCEELRKNSILSVDSTDNLSYRKAPGAIIREGVYIGRDAVIMPSYINIGAYIGERTMIDINAAIGSCAQIGKNCHIAALACIGGVLEPATDRPVIIGDDCFIGAQSAILEGIIVEPNSVIAAGVTISSSTKIIDRNTGEITHEIIPENSVVISGSYPSGGLNIPCAIIVKKIDSNTRKKTSINEILRTVE